MTQEEALTTVFKRLNPEWYVNRIALLKAELVDIKAKHDAAVSEIEARIAEFERDLEAAVTLGWKPQ